MSLATLMLLPRRRRPEPPRPAPVLQAVIRRARIRVHAGGQWRDTLLPGWDWRLLSDQHTRAVDAGHASTWLAARAQALDALEQWSHAA